MRANPLKSCSGFTFIAALMMVVFLGIMLGAVAQSWQMVMKRDKEAELLFRGGQILDAIARWRKPPPGVQTAQTQQALPGDLKDLLEDPRSAQKFHYLRKIYLDPITNKDFDVIRGQIGQTRGIIGVASSSNEKPIKLDFQNMSGVYKTFTNKEKYSDWKFVPKDLQGQIPGQSTITGLPPGQPPLPQ